MSFPRTYRNYSLKTRVTGAVTLLNGFDGYLAKPLLVEELIVQMKQCINPSQRPEDREMPCLC